ncbi:hypothetical protein [Paraglaciecola sp. MB-3u-78]|uniref:hypothetical protein n=1 Tax=Paraglaciecola sp. MB-3u-78 TaxID=2058332 RepID=UPI000C33DBF8|nr:hypothetical protein [Paraglaciecola sp. MB-3u-78]PKG95949.1 hypothetical protein CXF95_25095 [Paraglaciecola sp. MB-3u-78]
MKKFILITFVLLLSKTAIACNDEQNLNGIVKSFESAIISKDKSKFLNLFVDGTVSWVGVHTKSDYENELKWANSKEGIELKRKIGDKFREPAKYRYSTPEIFIDSIIDNPKGQREEISNIKIVCDGEIAAIYFDYIFYDGDRKSNSGKENWQLINTGNGWKINAVNFSIFRG